MSVRQSYKFSFNVTRCDGRRVVVEQHAANRELALARVRAFLALEWPGSRIEGDPQAEQKDPKK